MFKNKLVFATAVILLAVAAVPASGQQASRPVIVTNDPNDPVAITSLHDFFQERVRIDLATSTRGVQGFIAEMVPEGKIGVIEFASIVSLTSSSRSDREVFLEIRIVSANGAQAFGSAGFGSANLASKLGASEKTFLVVEPGDRVEIRVNRNVSGFAEAFFVTIAGRLFDAGG